MNKMTQEEIDWAHLVTKVCGHIILEEKTYPGRMAVRIRSKFGRFVYRTLLGGSDFTLLGDDGEAEEMAIITEADLLQLNPREKWDAIPLEFGATEETMILAKQKNIDTPELLLAFVQDVAKTMDFPGWAYEWHPQYNDLCRFIISKINKSIKGNLRTGEHEITKHYK
jgi:hypothetical protein